MFNSRRISDILSSAIESCITEISVCQYAYLCYATPHFFFSDKNDLSRENFSHGLKTEKRQLYEIFSSLKVFKY